MKWRFILLILFISAYITFPAVARVTMDGELVMTYYQIDSLSLHRRVTLEAKDVPLRFVLRQLSQRSGVRFLYDEATIRGFRKVSVNFIDETLEDALEELLKPLGLEYIISPSGRIIIVGFERARQQTGSVTGTVRGRNGEALVGATVLIRETRQGTTTNGEGFFLLRNLKPGTYTVEASYIGYQKGVHVVKIAAREVREIEFILESSAVRIGEMVVEATQELLPVETETKTQIKSAEIEHYQASSVGDVLDLVPGVQRTANPGLGKTLQAAVRSQQGILGGDVDLTAFGTRVIVDGIPISNNANLQFEQFTSAKTGVSTVGRGADLRLIPADNVESIEVIRGVPSVRYGELTSGLINVKTKAGKQPPRLKLKQNPDTREGNFGGGFTWNETGFSYNINAAQSERDIRVSGDEYTRLTGQLVINREIPAEHIDLNTKIFAQRIFDEEQPKGDVFQTRNYNRGYSLSYSIWGNWEPSAVSLLNFNGYINYQRLNSMKSRLVQSDLRILPSGDTISTYYGKVETRGNMWNIGGKLEFTRRILTGNTIHSLLLGSDIEYNANTGDGVLVDTLFNYYGSQSGKRSYSFDDIPGQVLLGLYAEDKIVGHLLFDYSFVLGARYDMYRPYRLNISGIIGKGDLVQAYQGSYFNPRVALMLRLGSSSQLRISAGSMTKSPPMSSIYPPPEVFRWRNPYDSAVVYFRLDRRAPDLKSYREKQFELSFDQKFMDAVGLSVSSYYKSTSDGIDGEPVPLFAVAQRGVTPTVFFVGQTSRATNGSWMISKGLELSFRTRKIELLNTEFQITAAYNYTKSGSNIPSYSAYPDTSIGQYPNYRVPGAPVDTIIGWTYPKGVVWQDNIVLNFWVRYVARTVGLWVSLRAEHLLWQRRQDLGMQPVALDRMTETQKLDWLFARRVKRQPGKWLFDINISKSLFKGAEFSFYVNNIFDNPGLYRYQFTSNPNDITEEVRNPPIFYGIEFSMAIEGLVK
ncbi:MAG: carboxypeptidase-like regulatory domain-containing protein [Bacteroidota bacterium]